MNQLFQNPYYYQNKLPFSQNYNQNIENNYSSINDFEILNELGKGSFGLVYKVRRKNDNEIYALKKVHLNQLKPKEKENSLNEIRILASLNNKNIIQYKDAFYDSENSSLCLVMEFAENGDLEKKISDLKKNTSYLNEYEILNIFIQICKGLKTLHDRKIMHRDIKCANIFLFKNNLVKIGDLNVSKIIKNNLHNTQTGTPYYASPEVWDNKQYDFKSDIWSLGCLLYELTCLKAPFRGTSMKMVYDKVMKGSYDPIPKFYSKALSGIIYICLQTNPICRPTCEQILNLIKEKIGNFNLQGQKLNVLYEEDDSDYSKKINFNSNIDTIPSSDRIIKYRNTENLQNKNISNVNNKNSNINNNNNINKYNKALTEESKGLLLNTIKMPKRLNDINSVLPKNRYSSTSRKIPNGKFDLIKRRLPKIRADLNFKFNNLSTLNKNYSNSNILDHNLSNNIKNNRSKIFTNKNLNSLNNNNKLLNRVYSEANMISEIYELNNYNNNNNNNKVNLIYNYNNNNNNRNINNNNNEGNKFNNMNYLNKSDESKNFKENNENEIKEEIPSNSNNTSMNNINNNNNNINENSEQNSINNNNNKNSVINTNSSSNVDKLIEDIIKNNNDYLKNYHYIHNVNIQENNLTEGNNIINNNNNNLNNNNNNNNKILPRSQSQQKYDNNFLQNERNININNLNINFNNLNNNNYNNNLSLNNNLNNNNNNNRNVNHYNFNNPIKLVNRNILKNKENINKSIGNEILKTKNLLTEKLGVHNIKRKIIDGDILTEKLKTNNNNNTYDIYNNNITVDNNKIDYDMQDNIKIFFKKLNKQPFLNNNNNNKIIKESKSYNNIIENKDNNISLSNLLYLNKNSSHNNLLNNNFEEIKEYKKIISNSTKNNNNTIDNNNKRSTSAKINFRPNFQKNIKKIPNNFHRKIDRSKINKNFLYNQQYISDNRKLRTNKINKDLSSNFLLPTIDKSEYNNSNHKDLINKNITNNILDEKVEIYNNYDFEFYNNNGFKKKLNNIIIPLSSKNDSVFSNYKKNAFNPIKLAPYNLNTLFSKYNKNISDENNILSNLNNNNNNFNIKKIENKDNNIDYLEISNNNNNNKKFIKKFKLLDNNLN